MTSISAPKKVSNFPFTGVLSDGMTFWVADANTGLNYQLTPNVISDFVKTALYPVPSNQIDLVTLELDTDTTIDGSFDGKVLFVNQASDIQLTFANTIEDPFFLNIVNVSSTSNVNLDFNGFSSIGPAVVRSGWLVLLKVANTFVGRT